MFGLLGSLFTFAFALLTRGDDEEPAGVQSRPAWLFFSATLGILIVLALVVPQLLGSSWMWRLRKDGLRGFREPHEPIKFDVEDLTTKAEALFNDIDKDDNDRLSLGELKKAVEQADQNRSAKEAEADAEEAKRLAAKAAKVEEAREKAEKEEKAAAEKAVLGTIVRQMEERTRKKQSLINKQFLAEAALAALSGQRAVRKDEAQLTKLEWDENVAESLY
jgi:hypothetical protein